jgi:hypothetical protein
MARHAPGTVSAPTAAPVVDSRWHDPPVARSLYKGERFGNRPPCAICVGTGVGERAELRLPYGITVWLCEEHRSAEFQRRRAGRDMVASLSWVWSSAGCMTRRREKALEVYRRQVLDGRAGRDLPGSYAWAELRREAERMFAGGHRPEAVVALIHGRPSPLPSRRTVYRWHAEGRWRAPLT